MPLQTTGPISLEDIQNEFGGTDPISLSEYYGVDTGIPTGASNDLEISIDDFYGASAVLPDFPVGTYYAAERTGSNPESVVVGYYYDEDIYVEAETGIDIRLVKTASGFQVRAGLGHNPTGDHWGYAQDYDYNETQLTNAADVLLFELTSATVDALKLDYSDTTTVYDDNGGYAAFQKINTETPAATYNITDNSWQTLSNGQSMGKRFNAITHTLDPYQGGANEATVVSNINIDVWARSSTRSDTLVAKLKFNIDAYAGAFEY